MKNRRILVIDDDVGVGQLIGRAAQKLSHTVQIVSDANDLMNVWSSYAPDLIFLDIVMPEPDGFEILRELGMAGCQAEIVLISGYDSRYLSSAKLLAETYGFRSLQALTKPVDLDDLRAVMGAA